WHYWSAVWAFHARKVRHNHSTRSNDKIGRRDVASGEKIVINLGTIDLDLMGALLWVRDAWELVVSHDHDQRLLGRHAAIMQLRELDVEITMRAMAFTNDNKYGMIVALHRFPYGRDQAATQVSLQETLETTREHAMASGIASEAMEMFAGLHKLFSGAILDTRRW
ncbi:hypothetical protein LTR17_019952, partial [Elasticomyces elasticus]